MSMIKQTEMKKIFCSGCENDKYDNGTVLIGTNHFVIESLVSVRISLSELIVNRIGK